MKTIESKENNLCTEIILETFNMMHNSTLLNMEADKNEFNIYRQPSLSDIITMPPSET